MKKETKVVALALVLLLLFLSGFGLGATKGINFNFNGKVEVVGAGSGSGDASANATVPAAPAAPATTAAPVTEAPTTAAPADTTAAPAPSDAPAADAPADTTAAPAGDAGANAGAVPSTKEEVAAAYCKALNDFKHYTGGVTLKRSETIDIQVKDLPAVATAIINPIVEKFVGTTDRTFTFENNQEKTYDEGSGPQPSDDRSISDRIVPGNRDATIDPAGLVSATATPGANGGYSIKLVFVAETAKYDGATKTNLSEPTYHKGALDPLNLGGIKELEGIITAADMSYPGATIEADIDGQGRLVKMHYNLPLEGSGTGKAVVTLTLGVVGSMDAVYEITYA